MLFCNTAQTSHSLSLPAGSLSIRTLPALPLPALSLFLPTPIITIALTAPVCLIGFAFPSVLPSYRPALSLLPQSPKDGLSQPESVVLSVFGYLLNKVILPIHKKRWLFRRVRHARYGRCGAHKFPIYWATHS